jgi:hypothetical protein
MPIRINLLAEAQELEEQRRRDPVKRVIIVGAILVGLILLYSSSLMVKTMVVKNDLSRLEGNLNSRTNQYRQVLENQKVLVEDNQKLLALQQLATNRLLMGTLLDGLQRATVDFVQLLRLKVEQTYTLIPEGKPKDKNTPGKPATITENIMLTLNARDSSPVTSDAVSKYQEALSRAAYFKSALGKDGGFRLTVLGAPQADPEGKAFVLFTLEARYPERTR